VRRRFCLGLLLVAGCNKHFHRDTNAPGLSDVENPPADRAVARVEPGDPGEEMLAVNSGILAGAGARKASPHALGEFGLEVSVVRGVNPSSHVEDGFFVYPMVAAGAALGWSALRLTDGDAAVGPLYAEVYAWREFAAAGGGWTWNPDTGDHGPQAFVSYLSLYLRGRLMADDGGEITAGFQGKLPIVWVWSR